MNRLLYETAWMMRREWQADWKNRYALGGILLYLVGSVFTVYFSFQMRRAGLTPPVWNSIYWIIFLFAGITTISRSFSQDRSGRWLYYYQVLSAEGLILAKILYHAGLMAVVSLLGLGFFVLLMKSPLQDPGLFLAALGLGSYTLSATLALVSSMAARAGGNASLMPILSFPILVPQLLMLAKLGRVALDDLGWAAASQELGILAAIGAMVTALSLVLFPYVWRS